MPFKKGHKLGHGGARLGAGAKPDWFKARCREMASSPRFLDWAQDVLDGKEVSVRITGEGGIVMTPPTVGERMLVWEKVKDTGFGKPPQAVDLGGEVKVSLADLVREARRARGLTAGGDHL